MYNPPTHESVWDTKTLVNIGLVIVNIILSLIINFWAYNKRKKDDRDFQISLELFKKLVIDSYKEIIEFTKVTNTIFNEAFTYVSSSPQLANNEIVQSYFNKFDHQHFQLTVSVFPILSFYSRDLKKNISKETMDFYEKFSNLFILLYDNPSNIEFLKSEMDIRIAHYIKNINKIIALHKPNIVSST